MSWTTYHDDNNSLSSMNITGKKQCGGAAFLCIFGKAPIYFTEDSKDLVVRSPLIHNINFILKKPSSSKL